MKTFLVILGVLAAGGAAVLVWRKLTSSSIPTNLGMGPPGA